MYYFQDFEAVDEDKDGWFLTQGPAAIVAEKDNHYITKGWGDHPTVKVFSLRKKFDTEFTTNEHMKMNFDIKISKDTKISELECGFVNGDTVSVSVPASDGEWHKCEANWLSEGTHKEVVIAAVTAGSETVDIGIDNIEIKQ